jgi:cytochrome oxidase Cu insertion factor (SCO1/SenC/PrrC family)
MKKLTALMSAVALVASVAAIAGPGKDKKPAKAIDVWTCPIQGAPVKDHSAKGVTYKNAKGTYNVHFCCGGCPESFAKLSAKEKDAKIAEALKKDAAGKGKG